jgi:CubicO group peptidase (beta-lactamase class C family)
VPVAFGVGFELQTERMLLGPHLDAFGHGGAGGSVHGAWPSRGTGFSYVTNRLRDSAAPDPRATRLLEALDASVRAR